MINIGELRNITAARERSKSTTTGRSHAASDPIFDSAAALRFLESTVPQPPQLSDFLPDASPSVPSPNTPLTEANHPENIPKTCNKTSSLETRMKDISLSSSTFLQDILAEEPSDKPTDKGVLRTPAEIPAEEDIQLSEADIQLSEADILLSYPVYSRYIRYLPMRDLLSLAKTSRAFRCLVGKERERIRRHKFEFVYKREFIRFLNLSLASKKPITQRQVFSSIFTNLQIQPEHILVFYSPDIFHYDLRVVDEGGRTNVGRADQILDHFMKQTDHDDLRVWHFRLFSIIRPAADPLQVGLQHGALTRLELNRLHLWHSEDLVMVVLPDVPNVRFVHQRLTFSSIMDIPADVRERNGGDLVALLLLIEKTYSPSFLLLAVRDIPRSLSRLSFGFPIIMFETQVFEGSSSEEWMCFAGDVTVYQVILDVTDKREVRDMKLHALSAQLGLTFPNNKLQCWLFYFTEMWPGGTSKEIPQCDILTLRNLFRGVPIFGGRAKRFMGNQHAPILAGGPLDSTKSLTFRMTPTIVTVVYFGRC